MAGITLNVPQAGQPRKAKAPAPIALPELRDELKLFEAAANADGTPAWMIQDPVNNRFFRIGWIEFELLVNWDAGEGRALVRRINETTPLDVTLGDLQGFLKFLSDHELVRMRSREEIGKGLAKLKQSKPSLMVWLVHHYLFFRIPLLRPQLALQRMAPFLQRFPWGVATGVVAMLTLAGLYLVSRQWDVFTHTFVDHLSVSGIVGYAFALVVAKTFHETGHALAATRYGVRVAHMGVAFLVMFPMLYTDTGESWRLKDNRQRLRIAAAGMAVELALAGACTFLWAVTPDGPMRNGLFFLATTSWVMTLLVNASPFMRFDGYFIASDLLDMPNLHQRSMALAVNWLRRVVLGIEDPWPESVTLHRRRLLIAFAVGTWIYRLTVFIGIAVLVYFYFFKVLGIVLMFLEIYWFIAKPVFKELGVWKARKKDVTRRRRAFLAVIAATLLLITLLPFQSSVHGDGWLHAERQQIIHSPFPAQLVELHKGGRVSQGDVLFTLDSKLLSIAQTKSRALAQAREAEIAGLLGLPEGEERRQLLQSQKAMFEAEARLSSEQRKLLTLRAPFDGELVDVDHLLSPGLWVKSREPLAALIDPASWIVDAYVEESDLTLIRTGQAARVRIATKPDQWIDGLVESIDVSRVLALPSEALDARHGGPIVTVEPGDSQINGERGIRVPQAALFRVRVRLNEPPTTQAASAVRVIISGESHSLLFRAGRRVASVFIRESGF